MENGIKKKILPSFLNHPIALLTSPGFARRSSSGRQAANRTAADTLAQTLGPSSCLKRNPPTISACATAPPNSSPSPTRAVAMASRRGEWTNDVILTPKGLHLSARGCAEERGATPGRRRCPQPPTGFRRVRGGAADPARRNPVGVWHPYSDFLTRRTARL